MPRTPRSIRTTSHATGSSISHRRASMPNARGCSGASATVTICCSGNGSWPRCAWPATTTSSPSNTRTPLPPWTRGSRERSRPCAPRCSLNPPRPRGDAELSDHPTPRRRAGDAITGGTMIRLAVQSRLVPGDSLRVKYETALGYGFDGMELSGPVMIDLAREAIASQIPVTAMCSGHRGWFIDPDPQQIEACIEDVKLLLELGAELDAPLIVVPIYGRTHNLPPHCGTGRTREEDRELWLEGLREVTDHAEKVGGSLLIEAINRFENSISVMVADAVGFAGQMASPNVRMMGDVFHMNIEEVDMGESLEAAGSMLGYAHLADSQRLEPGKGHLDWPNVLAGLVRMGYDRYASLECNLSGPGETVLPEAVRFLRTAIAEAEPAVDSGRAPNAAGGADVADSADPAGDPA